MPDEPAPNQLEIAIWWRRLALLASNALDGLLYNNTGRMGRWIRAVWLAGLFLAGVYLWGLFYSRGNIAFDFLDWAEVTGPRYALLRDAAIKGQLPLHAANTTALRGVTDRYFSIADTPFTPLYLLLPRMETGQYLYLETLLLYVAGFVGLVWIARRYRLAPLAFSLLFLLSNFNGFMTAHLAVGHSTWTGFFLAPYFALLVLELVERERVGWRWTAGLAVLLLVILLQGGFHFYLWCLLFLGLLALVQPGLLRPVALGILFSALVGLPRLLPPALALGGITQEYLGGFASVTDLLAGMIVLRDPYRAVTTITDTFRLNAWEIDFYIGFVGFAFLVIFGLALPLRRGSPREKTYTPLIAASLVFAALSVGDVFGQIVRVFTIPPLTGERVTARMFYLPLSILLVLAAIALQRELDRLRAEGWRPSFLLRCLFMLAGVLLFHDLYQHLEAWRIRYLDAMVDLFPKVPFDPAQHTIANHTDPVYTAMLADGVVIAVLTLALLGWLAAREWAARDSAQARRSRR